MEETEETKKWKKRKRRERKEKEIRRIRSGPQEASVTCEDRFGHYRVPKRACVI